jgi:bile acid:Na+ symporter, BASS family
MQYLKQENSREKNMFFRCLDVFSKLMIVWVLVAVGVGYAWPQALAPLKNYSDWLFAFTMFGIGMVLSPKDFHTLLRKPQTVGLGTLAQFAIMPTLAFLIAKGLNLPPQVALGLILAGAVPDAMAAGVVSYLAEADVALAVALTTGTTLISPLVTPALMVLFGQAYVPLQFGPMFLSIMKMVIVPLTIGLAIKHYLGRRADKFIPLFPAISTVFIAFICGLVVALNHEAILNMSGMVFIAVILLNAGGLVMGYGAGKLFRFEHPQCRTLAIGVGMQNAGMGAVLAIKHFSPEAALPNAFFATWCIVSASVLAGIWRKRK